MKLYTVSIPNAIPIGLVTAKATYGIGFLAAFVGWLCSLFGISNKMYTRKLEAAETKARTELLNQASEQHADGVMDVRCQIDGLSFLFFGTAYKLQKAESSEQSKSSTTAKATEKEKPLAAETKENNGKATCIPVEDGIIICSLCNTKQNSMTLL